MAPLHSECRARVHTLISCPRSQVNDGKVHFIKFYAPWCGHCKKLAPVWSELADELKHNKQVSIGQVDCTQAQDLCKKLEVTGYPTLKSFHAGESHAQFRGEWQAGVHA